MLLRTAKLVGFLRILIPQIAPLVANNAGLLSLRFVSYLVGFLFGSITSLWLPIVATLVSVTGAFNSASTNTQCQAYRAEMARIESINIQRMAAYRLTYSSWYTSSYQPWLENYKSYLDQASANNPCFKIPIDTKCISSKDYICNITYFICLDNYNAQVQASAPVRPTPPAYPQLLSYSPPSGGCGSTNPSINCPAGKKVWLQVLWGSPGGKASDSKGCFLVAYSQELYNLPVKIEYNPFLPVPFVTSRAASYYLVKGDRFRGLSTTVWKDLESVQGWDKGYWIAETVDPECRGWRPGWSRKVK